MLMELPLELFYKISNYLDVTDLHNLSLCHDNVKILLQNYFKTNNLLKTFENIFETCQIYTTFLSYKKYIVEQFLLYDDSIIILKKMKKSNQYIIVQYKLTHLPTKNVALNLPPNVCNVQLFYYDTQVLLYSHQNNTCNRDVYNLYCFETNREYKLINYCKQFQFLHFNNYCYINANNFYTWNRNTLQVLEMKYNPNCQQINVYNNYILHESHYNNMCLFRIFNNDFNNIVCTIQFSLLLLKEIQFEFINVLRNDCFLDLNYLNPKWNIPLGLPSLRNYNITQQTLEVDDNGIYLFYSHILNDAMKIVYFISLKRKRLVNIIKISTPTVGSKSLIMWRWNYYCELVKLFSNNFLIFSIYDLAEGRIIRKIQMLCCHDLKIDDLQLEYNSKLNLLFLYNTFHLYIYTHLGYYDNVIDLTRHNIIYGQLSNKYIVQVIKRNNQQLIKCYSMFCMFDQSVWERYPRQHFT